MDSLFEIRLEGHLDAHWVDWFDGMTLTPQADGTTLLSGPIVDQSALQGILRRVGELGMTLLSVNALDPRGHASAPESQHPASSI